MPDSGEETDQLQPEREAEIDPYVQVAGRLAGQELQLIEELKELRRGDSGQLATPDNRSAFTYFDDGRYELTYFADENIGGFGTKQITLKYSPSSKDENYNATGVDTGIVLDVGVNTEHGKGEQLKDYANPNDEQNLDDWIERRLSPIFIKTEYLFSPNGEYAKVVQLPRGFDDGRPEIKHFYNLPKRKQVLGEMSAGDFELAAGGIGLLKKAIESLRSSDVTFETLKGNSD